jgi:hypothetical protein
MIIIRSEQDLRRQWAIAKIGQLTNELYEKRGKQDYYVAWLHVVDCDSNPDLCRKVMQQYDKIDQYCDMLEQKRDQARRWVKHHTPVYNQENGQGELPW